MLLCLVANVYVSVCTWWSRQVRSHGQIHWSSWHRRSGGGVWPSWHPGVWLPAVGDAGSGWWSRDNSDYICILRHHQVHATLVILAQKGLMSTDELRRAMEALPGHKEMTYYHRYRIYLVKTLCVVYRVWISLISRTRSRKSQPFFHLSCHAIWIFHVSSLTWRCFNLQLNYYYSLWIHYYVCSIDSIPLFNYS